jgi:bifunctional non-homologous end joining protein LigD
LGVYERGELIYIGHSGGGFGAANLKNIYERLQPLIQKECPLKKKPPADTPVTWVKPELVCEVAFAGWTEDGLMRHPVFSRLREDNRPGSGKKSQENLTPDGKHTNIKELPLD